jgi:serine phosphatase RsbU (regulator of sigma subunit)/anti-sigma regulatory factor (Ser/Thr protein kinase)
VSRTLPDQSPRQLLRAAFRRSDDPYAGADPVTARRVTALLAGLAAVLACAFAPMSPPDEAIGPAGWAVLAVFVAGCLFVVRTVLRDGERIGFDALLAIAYTGVAGVAVLEVLAGGHSSYAALYMLWLGAGVGVHPPRRAIVFMAVVLTANALPLVYDGWTGATARAVATDSLLWLAIGAVLLVLIATVRGQRVRLRTVERSARAEAEEAAKRVRDLQQVTDVALAQLSLDELLGELLGRISRVLDLDAAAILLSDEAGKTLTVRAAQGVDADPDGKPVRIAYGDGCAGRVAAERRTVLLSDISTTDDLDPVFRNTNARALAGVPLVAGARVIGVIEAASERRTAFSPHDVRLLALAADRLSQAIERTRVNERAHHIAETLQRALLPDRLPGVPGVALAARYLPGGPGTDVGGDWYDVIPYADGRVGLVMGDVVGRGVAAASLMGQLRNAFRVYALDQHEPAAVLDKVNVLLHEFEPEQMATAVHIEFDPRNDCLCFAGAGHPPPVVRYPDGRAELLKAGPTAPLGVLPYTRYGQRAATLPPGSTLLVYTDGLVDRPDTSLTTGLSDLVEAVESAPAEPEELCEHVLGRLLPDEAPGDDIALLALQSVPIEGADLDLEVPADPNELALVRHSLARWLDAAQVDRTDARRVTVAANEACMNAIEHAFGPALGTAPEERVEVHAHIEHDSVEVLVRDHGHWRERRSSAGGRGIALMRSLMDEVDVVPSADGTTVRLHRAVALRQPPV